MNLTDENIKQAINILNGTETRSLSEMGVCPSYTRYVDYEKYRGKGRPRKSDYMYRDFLYELAEDLHKVVTDIH